MSEAGKVPSGKAMDRIILERSPWRRRGVVLAGLVGLAAAVYFASSRFGGNDGRSLEVAGDRIVTAKVVNGEFDDFVQVRGRFTPLKTIFIDTVQGGQVETLHVENGAMVEKGQLLVDLSNTALQLDVISREAQITEQLNNLRSLELAHEKNRLSQDREAVEVEYQITRLNRLIKRSAPLAESGATPRGELEEMRDELAYYKKRLKVLGDSQATADRLEKAQLVQLRTAARQLEKNLSVARKNLDGLNVRALASGRLTAFTLEVGQSLPPGERLGQIDDPTSYKILADIDEFYLGRVDIGQRALVEVDGKTHKLSIARIRPQVTGGRFQVDLVFDDSAGPAAAKVRRGQTAQARLQLGQPSKAVLIPNAAFFNDTGGAWVFVVARSGLTAHKREVRLGRRNPNFIEVLSGLSPGEEIVVSPYTSYLEMDRLELTAGSDREGDKR